MRSSWRCLSVPGMADNDPSRFGATCSRGPGTRPGSATNPPKGEANMDRFWKTCALGTTGGAVAWSASAVVAWHSDSSLLWFATLIASAAAFALLARTWRRARRSKARSAGTAVLLLLFTPFGVLATPDEGASATRGLPILTWADLNGKPTGLTWETVTGPSSPAVPCVEMLSVSVPAAGGCSRVEMIVANAACAMCAGAIVACLSLPQDVMSKSMTCLSIFLLCGTCYLNFDCAKGGTKALHRMGDSRN